MKIKLIKIRMTILGNGNGSGLNPWSWKHVTVRWIGQSPSCIIVGAVFGEWHVPCMLKTCCVDFEIARQLCKRKI